MTAYTERFPDEAVRRRYMALAQWRRRQRNGQSTRNPCSIDLQTVSIVVAWEAGYISEGEAVRALQLGHIEFRELRDHWRAEGRRLARELAQYTSYDLTTPLPPALIGERR